MAAAADAGGRSAGRCCPCSPPIEASSSLGGAAVTAKTSTACTILSPSLRPLMLLTVVRLSPSPIIISSPAGTGAAWLAALAAPAASSSRLSSSASSAFRSFIPLRVASSSSSRFLNFPRS